MSDIIIDKLSAKRTIENVLEKWVTEYKNIGELLNIMVAKKNASE